MANFNTVQVVEQDQYMTPKSAWESIQHLIPRGRRVWECFYGDGTSGQHLRDLGFDVVHDQMDFFTEQPDAYDIIVSNPPYSKIKQVLKRLHEGMG